MVKHTNQENIPIGHIFDNQIIEVMPYFIYEISLNKYWKNGYCVLAHKFYKSNKLLNISDEIKHYDDYIISKEIVLLGAPENFIKDLPIYQLKKKNGTRRSIKRPIC